MRYRLRTLLIWLAALPPVLAVCVSWFLGMRAMVSENELLKAYVIQLQIDNAKLEADRDFYKRALKTEREKALENGKAASE